MTGRDGVASTHIFNYAVLRKVAMHYRALPCSLGETASIGGRPALFVYLFTRGSTFDSYRLSSSLLHIATWLPDVTLQPSTTPPVQSWAGKTGCILVCNARQAQGVTQVGGVCRSSTSTLFAGKQLHISNTFRFVVPLVAITLGVFFSGHWCT